MSRIEKVHVISHTHWDREWYQPFQEFRIRLVYVIDELLDKMKTDPNYRYFTLDGQTIVVDDYLAIRPERASELLGLIREGRIFAGPWYCLPDEFLVSGESLVRNLLKGVRKVRSWGAEPLKSGYITDMFGHNSQMPQIFSEFGIDHALFFRGFRGGGDPSEIWWEGADGTRILGLKLDEDRAYGDFFFFLRWPFSDRDFQYDAKELIARAKAMLEYKAARATAPVILLMDGVDHIEIEPRLPWMLDVLNAAEELGSTFVHSHLENYLQELKTKLGDLRVFCGEQRETGYRGLNNVVLANVLSSRIHLKQRNHHCETLLEKWAEPWGVFAALEGRPYPKSLIQKSWEYLLQNHAHDSICGCSVDQVHKDMIYRFDQSRLIAEQMIKEQIVFIADHVAWEAGDGDRLLTVFNASQSEIRRVIQTHFDIPCDAGFADKDAFGQSSFRLLDERGQEIPHQLLAVDKGLTRRFRPYRSIPSAEQVNRYHIAFEASIPPYGYRTYRIRMLASDAPVFGEYASDMKPPVRYPGTMRVDPCTWDNGKLRLSVNGNGTIDVTLHATGKRYKNLLGFVDEADSGDGWNHVAPVTNETVLSRGASAHITVVHDGPFLTAVRIEQKLMVPENLDASETKRAERRVALPIVTEVSLEKDSEILKCRTIVYNTARNHRLKLMLPTGIAADRFYTSTPFDFVQRPIRQPDRRDHLETHRNVFPHNGIIAVHAGRDGLAVYSKGLYEMTIHDDESRTLALTLFRGTGKEVLSDGGDGGQLLGKLEFEYAVRPYAAEEVDVVRLFREHQQFAAGLRSVDRKPGTPRYETPFRRSADLPVSKSFMKLENQALVVSAIKEAEDEAGRWVIRLFNPTSEPKRETIVFDRKLARASLVNLDERHKEDLAVEHDRISVAAGPKKIVTVMVAFA